MKTSRRGDAGVGIREGPICSKSLGDMTVYFGMLDGLLAAEELPEVYFGIYRNRCQVHYFSHSDFVLSID
uniref:Uncharacterized protein n=1 Tax=Aegilops tauschii subsp. strangulata TaxID=200361 RepID=A0A453AKT4_AEGTS